MPMGKTILLAEDSPKDAELVLQALAENELAERVHLVRDGAEALDYLYSRGAYAGRDNGNPAVVLLDIDMPRVSGVDVLRQIKADPQLRTLPVVMLTSSRAERDLVESYCLGVNAYVVKPGDLRDFAGAVKRLGFFWLVLNELPPDFTAGFPPSKYAVEPRGDQWSQ